MDNTTLISNIIAACKAKGEKVTPALINAGVGHSFVQNLKRGQVPAVDKVARLAAYLGVTTSELLGEEVVQKEPTTPQGDELSQKFASLFAQLTPEQKELVVKTMREMNKGK